MNPTTQNQPNPIPPSGEPTSGLAIASLVLGICSLGCSIFTAIPALICGGMALAKINKPASRLGGRGQAIAGLVLGGLGMFTSLPILAALLIPAVQQARGAAQEAACMNNVRQIGTAIQLYALENTNRLPAKLEDLESYIKDIDGVSRCPAHPGAGVAYEFTHETDRIDGAPDAIVLKEVPGNHRRGRVTLRADGSVEIRAD